MATRTIKKMLGNLPVGMVDVVRLFVEAAEEGGLVGKTREEVIAGFRRVVRAGVKAVREEEKTLPFREVVERSLEARKSRRKSTVYDLRSYAGRMVRYGDWAGRPLRGIGVEECREMLQEAFGHSDHVFRKARAILHSLFAFGMRQGWCACNPVDAIDAPQVIEKRIEPLTVGQIARLMEVCREPDMRDMEPAVVLMLWCGVRPAEVQRLTWADVDPREGVVYISPQHSKTGGARFIPLRGAAARLRSGSGGGGAIAPATGRSAGVPCARVQDCTVGSRTPSGTLLRATTCAVSATRRSCRRKWGTATAASCAPAMSTSATSPLPPPAASGQRSLFTVFLQSQMSLDSEGEQGHTVGVMLNLYDTQSGAMKPVQAEDGKQLRFYCCGPTVYAAAHIGNFRTFVVQDVFRRVVELGGQRTKHVRNLTDVDDKTIRNSQAQGMPLNDYTAKWTRKFHEDCAALNCLQPHVEPSAVGHIAEQIELVRLLMDKGHAYQSEDGSVYFRISSYPEYGRLAHLDRQTLDLGKTANVRADTDEYEKDSVADFVLWKARRPEDGPNFWPSPWGEGRPGWHLECSAMSHKYLGDTFDLHSGGVDLVFPHHENEIAQSRCACGGESARHWFHIAHLLVDGAKMSKSLGNMYTLDELQEMGYRPNALRYVLAGAYYRRPLNFTLSGMKDATSALNKLGRFDKELAKAAACAEPTYKSLVKKHPEPGLFQAAWESLEDDLNTPEALGHVFSTIKGLKPAEMTQEEATATWLSFRLIMEALGLQLPDPDADVEVPDDIRAIADERWQARLAKDWATADALRATLADRGWAMKDGKDGYKLTKA